MGRHLLALLLTVVACAAPRANVTATPDAARAHLFVLLRPTATLHPAREAPGASVRAPWEKGDRLHTLGRERSMRVVEDHGEWLLVENLPGDGSEQQCHGSIGAIDRLRLRLWVRESDLALATVRPLEQTFANGTRIRLSRGQAMYASPKLGEGYFTAVVSDVRIPLLLRGGELGTRFPAPDLIEPGKPIAYVHVGPKSRKLKFGAGGSLGWVGPHGTFLDVHEKQAHAGGLRITSFHRCATLVLDVDGEDPASGLLAALGGLGSRGSGRPVRSVRAGATVWWPDGTRAGEVVEEASYPGTPVARGARTCFPQPLWRSGFPRRGTEPQPMLELCFDARDVLEHDRRTDEPPGGEPDVRD